MIEFKEQDWGVRLNEKNYCKFDLDAPDWAKDLPSLSLSRCIYLVLEIV